LVFSKTNTAIFLTIYQIITRRQTAKREKKDTKSIFLKRENARKEEREKSRKGEKRKKCKRVKGEYEIGVSRFFAFFFSRFSRSLF
jgi:hypothetical protein